jgi:hypothetical protein
MNRDIRTSVDNDRGIRTASQRIDDATTRAEKEKRRAKLRLEEIR